jgi:hypothetical protein
MDEKIELFARLLKATYGLEPVDVDMERISNFLSRGDSPEELIQWIGEKYVLVEVKATHWRDRTMMNK